MESFPNAKTIRLKGPHGKYLWASDDHYRTSQKGESRNAKACWRVEHSDHGSKKTVRFRSCFDTYLTADDGRHHDLSLLGFSGRKVVQMRPENVASCATLEWEPIAKGSFLKLKTCYGTFLRASLRGVIQCPTTFLGIPKVAFVAGRDRSAPKIHTAGDAPRNLPPLVKRDSRAEVVHSSCSSWTLKSWPN